MVNLQLVSDTYYVLPMLMCNSFYIDLFCTTSLLDLARAAGLMSSLMPVRRQPSACPAILSTLALRYGNSVCLADRTGSCSTPSSFPSFRWCFMPLRIRISLGLKRCWPMHELEER